MRKKHIRPNEYVPAPTQKNTPEHSLWYAVIETYFLDLQNPSLSDDRIAATLSSARHWWTLKICETIGLDHGFLLRKLDELLIKSEPARLAWRKKRAERMAARLKTTNEDYRRKNKPNG